MSLTRPSPPVLGTCALFLDVDGTLLPLEDRPEQVRSDPELNDLLESLRRRLDGALCLVSGRPVADIDRIFAPAVFPAAGSHGAELRRSPESPIEARDIRLPPSAVEALKHFVDRHPALLLEEKPTGASLHYRAEPALEAACRDQVASVLAPIDRDFRLIDGKMVLELAPRQLDKGNAIETLMQHAPYLGRQPVFIGDDVTDEDGFRSVNRLGGQSIRVGATPMTTARHVLEDVPDVLAWLHGLDRVPSAELDTGD